MAIRGPKPAYRVTRATPEEVLAGTRVPNLKDPTKDQILADQMANFYDDPLGYVMFSFDWENDASIQIVELKARFRERFNGCVYGPDEWTCDFFDEIGQEVRLRGFNGRTAVQPIRFGATSGHGIGKSTTAAFVVNWIKDTRPLCRGTVTANTSDQLKAKTWAEIVKWKKKAPTSHWFTDSSTRGNMEIRHKQKPDEWFVHGQTCREENSEAFAGQHAANSTSFYMNDEGSAIPDKIYEVEEGGLSDGEPHIYIFGNPTRNSGKFFKIFNDPIFTKPVAEGGQGWKLRQIDSREVAITNKEKIAQDIATYGLDSDFVRVRWRGLFPKKDQVQFISSELVKQAQQRHLPDVRQFRRSLGVDMAGSADGDELVLYPKKGPDARTFPAKRFKGLSPMQAQSKIIEEFQFFERIGDPIQMCFIDVTGGWGHAMPEALQMLGYPVTAVNFGWTANNWDDYVMVCDELWGRGREALMGSLCLPAPGDPDWTHADGNTAEVLATQLTDRWCGTTEAGQNRLESKKDLKKRVGYSPDVAEGLLLNFFQELGLAEEPAGGRRQRRTDEEDPIDKEFE